MLAQLHTQHIDLTRPEQIGGDRADAVRTETDAVRADTASPVLDLALEVDTSFWVDAACAEGDGSFARLFFSEELRDIAAAKRICAQCSVLEQCLEGALARKEPLGVWGGQLFQNGKVLQAKRRRGRPPKNPRPEDEFVHIEVPVALRPLVERRTA